MTLMKQNPLIQRAPKFSIFLFAIVLTCGLAGCQSTESPVDANDASVLEPHDALMGTLWVQTSGEYWALCEQAYGASQAFLENALADTSWSAAAEQVGRDVSELPPAIIVDVDETVLDNSPYQARLIETGGSYDEKTWAAWCALAEAEAVPGSLNFLQAADALGVTVFYITNRAAPNEVATRKNLKSLGFPLDDSRDTLLLNEEQPNWNSSKIARRALVAENYRILFIAGDDLNDFVTGFKTGDPLQRKATVAQYSDRFGREWILLPNPQYGSWEASLYGRDYSLGDGERRRQMHQHLRSYSPSNQ
jgi:acid phosphatase